MTDGGQGAVDLSAPYTQGGESAISQLVQEIADGYSDDGSSSIEAPIMLEDDENLNDMDNSDEEGNDHATTDVPEPPRIVPAREQRVPNASRVAARLKQAETGYTPNMYRSNDLLPLQREYGSMKRSLKSLLNAATAYCEATKELAQTQSQFIHSFEGLVDGSPLQSFVIREHDSLVEVQEQATMYHGFNISEYQQQILAYIEDWIATVSNELDDKLINQIPKLRATRNEYEGKMEKLLNKQQANPETFDQNLPEFSLETTQQKMYEAIQEHEDACSKACYMIDQVVRKGWKDLYPLMKKMMKWELNQLGRDNKSFGQFLPETLKNLSQTTIASLEDDLMKKNELERSLSGPQSFYGNAAVVEDYLDYLPPELPHLFVSDACPYSQMAWMAFLEKERNAYNPTNFQMHYVCNFLKYKDPGFKLLSKLGIVDSTPVLLHKGNVFHESTTVLEYIDSCFPDSSTCPSPSNGKSGVSGGDNVSSIGQKRLTPTNAVDAFNMSLFLDRYAGLPKLYQKVLEHRDPNTAAVSTVAGQELLKLLEMLDTDLRKCPGPFLCGYPFTLADIFLIPFVERIQVVLKHYREFEIPATLTKLRAWFKVATARSSVKVTMADRTNASLHTCGMTNSRRADYLIEYNEAAAKGELALAQRLFAAEGSPGQNPYQHQETVKLGLGAIPMEEDGEDTGDREFIA